jgi:hypothetical protein
MARTHERARRSRAVARLHGFRGRNIALPVSRCTCEDDRASPSSRGGMAPPRRRGRCISCRRVRPRIASVRHGWQNRPLSLDPARVVLQSHVRRASRPRWVESADRQRIRRINFSKPDCTFDGAILSHSVGLRWRGWRGDAKPRLPRWSRRYSSIASGVVTQSLPILRALRTPCSACTRKPPALLSPSIRAASGSVIHSSTQGA